MAKIILIPILISIISLFTACSGNSQKERDLFEKIEKGMTKAEVIEILGQPDTCHIDSLSNNKIYCFFFTKNKSSMRSDMPTVIMDSSGIVIYAYYDSEPEFYLKLFMFTSSLIKESSALRTRLVDK